MSFLRNKRLLWEVAKRGLAGLLVFALVCSLSLDLGHHAGHAGQSHATHVTADAKVSASGQVEHSIVRAAVTTGQHDQHSGTGISPDCDCCSVSCVPLVIFSDIPSIAAPVPSREALPLIDSAIPKGLAPSTYRPPIAIL